MMKTEPINIKDFNSDLKSFKEIFYGGKIMQNKCLSSGNEVIDELLSGGYKYGQLIEISGNSDTGKTLLSLQAVKETQLKEKMSIYIDAGHGLTLENIKDNDIDENLLLIIRPQFIEELAMLLSEAIKPNMDNIGLIVIDSLADLITKKEKESSILLNTSIHRSKVIKALLMRIGNMVRKQEACALVLNQLRTKFDTTDIAKSKIVSSSEKWVELLCDTRIRLFFDEDNDIVIDVKIK